MAGLINYDAYPIDETGSKRDSIVQSVRKSLRQDGCAVLRGFLTQEALESITQEVDLVADRGHRSFNKTNPYFTADDPSLPENHPKRRFFERSNCFIPADNFHKTGSLRQVHDSPGFDRFIQDCLEEPDHCFFRYADPLADVIVNAAQEGNGFPWHFDTNNFTVTLAIQNANAGGAFEYAPNIRSIDENFEEVGRVLDGSSDKVVSLELQPGDLQLFKGRYSLHRVAPLVGERPRYVAIFSYVEEPNMVGAPERTRQLYGRVLPIHLERAGMRSDSFID
ncbi:phytanoyl-CoA dioxygenase PhyH [Shimia isoporae]|uniref:Phytanoyl-CoA dioxygenase PhyH n=1 Tax=Shimia isoporae TaxID=647720 RepID=A0A4R1NNA7_9RHOB|nr:phytanoyl-CoA dioxygenase family protein [Shimia isoporae]TCL09834.1 phytanoyl-CoA dioxygenase PhyH [Shimia isoporae]